MNPQLKEFLSYPIGEKTAYDFVLAFLLFLLLFVGFRLFKIVVVGRLRKIAKGTSINLDDQLIRILDDVPAYFYYVVSLYFPLKMLLTSGFFLELIEGVFIVVLVYQGMKVLKSLINYFLSGATRSQGEKKSTTFYGIKLIVNFALWTVALLLIFSNLGFDVTSLVASLGIGGIAVALAAQNILGDIFASFSIYFDRPFEIGDYIVIDKNDGFVEKIGLKTTRIRTLDGDELVVSNNELVNSRVRNYKKMEKRRVVAVIGLTYETSNANLKKAKKIMTEAVEKTSDVEFNRCFFYEFGPHSLNFELVYYVLSDDKAFALDREEEINLKIKEAFEKAKIEIAYPTQTVYVVK